MIKQLLQNDMLFRSGSIEHLVHPAEPSTRQIRPHETEKSQPSLQSFRSDPCRLPRDFMALLLPRHTSLKSHEGVGENGEVEGGL